MLFLLFLILLGLGIFIFIHYQKHNQVNQLYNQAIELEKNDTDSPNDITKLQQALTLYKHCNKLINHYTYTKAAHQCQKKIDDCQRFQNLLSAARKKAQQKLYKKALKDLLKAKNIFVTKELEDEIYKCKERIEQQENYEKVLKQSAEIARQGKFTEAINLLKPTLQEFDREDGQQLLTQLERVIQAKELYNLGLIAENKGEFRVAIDKYQQALHLLPEFEECKIRLGIIAAKKIPDKAIVYLEGIESQQSAYIRGFAHVQLENWQQAYREWQHWNLKFNFKVKDQCLALKPLVERDRLLQIQEIESVVDNNNLETAKTLSLEFINKFGSEPLVQQNLEEHIQPLLEREIWGSKNWQQIASKTEQIWLEQQDIKSLHNWAVATYYQAQTNPNKLFDFIIAWSTALANIQINPAIKNILWLGNNSVDLKDVSIKLKQILESTIDTVKDKDIKEYLRLRDVYRRDMVALSLIQNNSGGMRIKQQLLVLPSCYLRYRDRFSGIRFPAKVWGALYTAWGLAVAACHEQDTARAIKIKPSLNPSNDTERFAQCFISYHEGCHYLQNFQWREAIKPFQLAQFRIKAQSDWCKEIDQLCELQQRKIKNFEEHLEFGKFWYELTASKASASYFAEKKAIQVGIKLDDKKITLQQGLNELQKIRKLDPNNPTTLDLIEKVEFNLELEKIDLCLKRGEFQQAVRLAKASHHEQIRFIVAEICIDIILKASQSPNLDFQALYQFARWAYELCPYEPAFQPIYRELRQIGMYF